MGKVRDTEPRQHLNIRVKYGQYTWQEVTAIFIFLVFCVIMLELPVGLIGLVPVVLISNYKKKKEKKKQRNEEYSDFFRDIAAKKSHSKYIEDRKGILKYLINRK